MFDRRALLLGTIAAISADALTTRARAEVTGELPAFASAARQADGSFSLVLLSRDGAVLRNIPLSARGHDVAIDTTSGRAVVFARRPGAFAVAFDLRSAAAPMVFTAIEGRHFFGHGAFSRDGRLLYVSENDIAGARGVIGIYDVAAGYRKIGEHSSYGLGPHEIILLADGRTLAVANGGLDTAPEAGRENLNLDAMEPSLAFIDAASGALKARHALTGPLRRLSMRHIAADRAGRIWFGGQWEGELSQAPALIGSASLDSDIHLIADESAPTATLKGYIGSVAMGGGGTILAASAPKAGRVVYLDCISGRIIAQSDLRDACGVAGEADGVFCVSSGFGALRHERPGGAILSEAELANLAFDNHLRRIA
ncbi:MAG: DUF1513 domain-containing protein [Hyphomicrobium sp.]